MVGAPQWFTTCVMAFPPWTIFPAYLANCQQHRRMSLECFCRLCFIANVPKKLKIKIKLKRCVYITETFQGRIIKPNMQELAVCRV
ncbi:hypothetical protein B0H17DRAFT_503470 [Mycena rosella]|uniref:Uncharacterized protein n=1 Tax=Mycena rosella TaxID=1033263 RepID=A0AAD7C0N2_MYCRO|nr:hypothetical protein B0H17DRAFT_503470 [Mycena rosella]